MVSGGLERPGSLATTFLCTLLLMSICIKNILCERSSLWEIISSSILDIIDYKVKSNEIVLTKATA